jgi:hypothetical protein
MASRENWIGDLPDFDIAPLAEQKIVCAAQRNYAGIIVTGARHFDRTMVNMMELLDPQWKHQWSQSECGFIDQFGTFLTREQAWIVALRNNQIIKRVGGDEGCLYSENLYL